MCGSCSYGIIHITLKFSGVKQCSAQEFQCKTMSSCIPLSWQCDNDKDCVDGSDEENCSGKICSKIEK